MKKRVSMAVGVFSLSAALACSDRTASGPENGTDPPPPAGFNVSEPGALPATNIASTSGSFSVAASKVAFVSAEPGTIPSGLHVKIRDTSSDGPAVAADIVDGGFDPLAIPAQTGDKLEVSVVTFTQEAITYVVSVPPKRPPIIVRTNPAKGRIDVALNQVVTVVFSEPVNPATVSAASIKLLRSGTTIEGTVTVAPDGLSASLAPVALLDPNTVYQVEITTQIRDLEGDPLDAGQTVSFTTGAPVSPTQPSGPSSIRIVFDRIDGTGIAHLYAMNGDGSDLVQLTTGPSSDTSPSVSPDGTHIAFVRAENVVVMNADGSDMHQVTTGGGMAPRWSPDGTKILFEAGTAIAFGDIKSTGLSVINADGTGLVQLTTATPDKIDGQANWSPDGQKIAFRRDENLEFEVVWVINADGTGLQRLGRREGSGTWASWGPVWSSAGRIVFVGPNNALVMSIFGMNADGSAVGLLSSFPSGVFVNKLDDRSADGQWYTLTVGALGSSPAKDVYLLSSAGSAVRITNDGRSSSAAFLR
jgi:hypothetical protein